MHRDIARTSSVDTLERFDYVEPENERRPTYSMKKLQREREQQKRAGGKADGPELDTTSNSSSADMNFGTPFSQGSSGFDGHHFPPHHPPHYGPGDLPPPFTPADFDYHHTPGYLPPHPQTPSHHGPPPMTPHHPMFNDNNYPPPPHGPGMDFGHHGPEFGHIPGPEFGAPPHPPGPDFGGPPRMPGPDFGPRPSHVPPMNLPPRFDSHHCGPHPPPPHHTVFDHSVVPNGGDGGMDNVRPEDRDWHRQGGMVDHHTPPPGAPAVHMPLNHSPANSSVLTPSSSSSTPSSATASRKNRDPRCADKALPPPLEIPKEIPMERKRSDSQPDSADADNEDEPRFMSLESRIQSLLQGGSDTDDKEAAGKAVAETAAPELDLLPPSSLPPGPLPPVPPHSMPPQSEPIGWDPNSVHIGHNGPPPHLPHPHPLPGGPIPPPPHMMPPHHPPHMIGGHLPPQHPHMMGPPPSGHMIGPPPHPHPSGMDMWGPNHNGGPPMWPGPHAEGGMVPPHPEFEPSLPQHNSNNQPSSNRKKKNKKRNKNGRGGGKFGSNGGDVGHIPPLLDFPGDSPADMHSRDLPGDRSSPDPLADIEIDPVSEDSNVIHHKHQTFNGKVAQNNNAADIEDDRMSLDSISSGEEKLEVADPTQPSHATFNGSGWPGQPFSESFRGPFGPDYEPETDFVTHMFSAVLSDFVKELKSIMQRDLCKKMVETSAFKYFENWWDQEEEKNKVRLISRLIKSLGEEKAKNIQYSLSKIIGTFFILTIMGKQICEL